MIGEHGEVILEFLLILKLYSITMLQPNVRFILVIKAKFNPVATFTLIYCVQEVFAKLHSNVKYAESILDRIRARPCRPNVPLYPREKIFLKVSDKNGIHVLHVMLTFAILNLAINLPLNQKEMNMIEITYH